MFICSVGLILIVVAVVVAIHFILRSWRVNSYGKAVLITGCDRGFGRLLAVHLSTLGYRVFAGCLKANDDNAAELKRTSSRITPVQLDVTKDSEVTQARVFVESQLGDDCLWAVVNNAGIMVHTMAEWTPLSTYRSVMDVNWMGTVRVTLTFLPLLRASKGRLVNVASAAGRCGVQGFAAYSSSKFAVVGLSDCLRREMIKFGIKVSTIEPVIYKTPMADMQVISRQNIQMWNEATQEVRDTYGEEYFKAIQDITEKTVKEQGSKRLRDVIEDMAHAVTATYPKVSYLTAPRKIWLASWVVNNLPSFILDFLLKVLLKAPCAPRALVQQRLKTRGGDQTNVVLNGKKDP